MWMKSRNPCLQPSECQLVQNSRVHVVSLSTDTMLSKGNVKGNRFILSIQLTTNLSVFSPPQAPTQLTIVSLYLTVCLSTSADLICAFNMSLWMLISWRR